MKLQFDAELDYQHEAIRAVTNLFEGMPASPETAHTTLGIANPSLLAPSALFANLHRVQARHDVPLSPALQDAEPDYSFPNFSIEMETGTGKTYVYLRTLFELNRRYGLRKFIIVVPSVAIREGVLSTLRLMREHLGGLYENVASDSFVYQSNDLSRVRRFAASNTLQIMVINIQSFQKETETAANVIHREQDTLAGLKPIDLVRSTRPVVVIDEPQSVDTTTRSRAAIAGLNPLFCLRYSATHVRPYHLLYRLGPVRAYDLGLVKQIEVVAIGDSHDYNRTLVRLDWVGHVGRDRVPRSKVTLYANTPDGPRTRQVTLTRGADLTRYTDRPDYAGFLVTDISAEPGNEYVEFANGEIVRLHRESGGVLEERMKSQLRATLECHFAKEKALRTRGIKVLSLFFIDRVSDYRYYDGSGKALKGKLAQWFEQLYEEIAAQPDYRDVIPHRAAEVHDGYFSVDRRKGRPTALLDTSGRTAKDDDTYRLIMQDKARLLSPEEPLRFIFSHSALREGWDNPNVFQICTLRETGTERERRQTIGRGLRLPVDQMGKRVHDAQVNRLTVIANEPFRDFASGLQADIERAIDPSGRFKFGCVPPLAFTSLADKSGAGRLSPEQSRRLWMHLQEVGVLDSAGQILTLPAARDLGLTLPDEFETLETAVATRLQQFQPRPFVKDARQRRSVRYNERVALNPQFKALWERIGQKTRYLLAFDTAELVADAAQRINRMAAIPPVTIEMTRRDVKINAAGVAGREVVSRHAYTVDNARPLPDILRFLQRETELTRASLVAILKACGRLGDFARNPQLFMTEAARQIHRAMQELGVAGIRYEAIAGQRYEMRLFEEKTVEEYCDRLYQVQRQDDRSLHDAIICDSEAERAIAATLDADDRVKFFCRLPHWFRIPTPLGDYTPDWALVVEEGETIRYLVREARLGSERDDLQRKAACAQAHFEALGVDFKLTSPLDELAGK
ncbi:DEAD/DEAH box helicase family protein [Halomonas shantousis]